MVMSFGLAPLSRPPTNTEGFNNWVLTEFNEDHYHGNTEFVSVTHFMDCFNYLSKPLVGVQNMGSPSVSVDY